MKLHTYPDIIQGTGEWDTIRRGHVTASTVGRLVTPSTLKVANNDTSRAVTAAIVAERITGYTERGYVSSDMWRGIEDEPRARAVYAEHHAPVDELGFMLREGDGWKLGYSPDGLVGDDGLIEIKSYVQKRHLQIILAGEVPPEHMAQLQAGLLVSGRAWIDFVSYCSGMPLWVKRVEPDQRWHNVIVAACEQFEMFAAEMTASYHALALGLPMTERIEMDLVI